jgi:hypothetical protein
MWKATLILSTALMSGCASAIDGDFCDLARPIYFDSADTINWLAENDIWMLRSVVAHNEVTARCR